MRNVYKQNILYLSKITNTTGYKYSIKSALERYLNQSQENVLSAVDVSDKLGQGHVYARTALPLLLTTQIYENTNCFTFENTLHQPLRADLRRLNVITQPRS